MKCKRILSLLLTLCMVIGLLPGMAFTAAAASPTEVSTWADLKTAFETGGEITLTSDVTATDSDGALQIPKNVTVTLDLAGHKINRNLNVAKSVGNVINVEGTLTVNDSSEGQTGAITGGFSNTGVFAGAAVCVKTGGAFTLNSGNISENKAPGNGTFGAGVVVQDNATFIMNGGSVSKNQSGNLGGGVAAAAKATVKLLGGRIENNTAASAYGGGVYFYGSNVTVGGSIVIQNNTAKGKTNNVHSGGSPLLLSKDTPLTTDAKIGWTASGTVNSNGTKVATGEDAAKYLNNFFSDSPSYIIGVKKNDSKTIWIAQSGSHTVTRPVKRSITITAGQHMTKTANSGAASQTDLSGAMTAVVYTAESGYYFPENYVSSISGLTNGELNGISVTRNSETQITVSGTPTAETKITLPDAVAVPAPIFDACNGRDPVESKTLPDDPTWRDYDFAGWYTAQNGGGTAVTADSVTAGSTYYAKWTKNGKTVRTTSLDLTAISARNPLGATLTDGVYTNADEGWSWNPETKTLTLSGATMDIQISGSSHIGVHLPADATVATAENTKNAVSVTKGSAFVGSGNLTIDGQGSLTVVGESSGICTGGNIAINAPIDVSITGDEIAAIYIESESAHSITIHEALDILTPAGGRINNKGRVTYIAESDGTTSARNVVIGVAKKYTVTYNTNGGSAVSSATVSEGNKLTAPEAPTKAGYTFLGWYKDAAFTNSWNFDADTVTSNTTLYAKWTEATKIYGISGTVYEFNSTTPASGVTVKLMKGDTEVASATSASNGAYNFTGIAPGVYNIVANDGTTNKTELVMITDANREGVNITMPPANVSSALTVSGTATPDVVAGGLAEESAAVKAANSSAISVKVEMTVESKSSAGVNTADKTNIETVASGKTLEYLDIKVTKTVDSTVNPITETENMMEIIIPYDMTGKSNITVYRNHSGSATAFTQLSALPGSGAADGTYYLDTANHLIYVYTQMFSTYAIGYNTQSGGGSGSGGSSSGGGSSSSSGGSSSGNSSSISTPSAKNGTVSVSPKSASKGTTVTVTVTPDKGYVLETLTVTDASGKKLDLKNLGSGKYSFTMPASKVEVKATFMEDNTMLNYFVDVPASAYYYDAVLWAAEQGITGGTDATHFSPDGVCTRAQAVTFLWRAAGSPAPSATAMPFTDVAADSYYYNAVLWAMENGITAGTSSTTFSPDLKCSRAHIMTFLWRSEKSPAAGSVNPFTDVSADAYYADAVLWAVKESVTNGTSSATFSPDADCTRAQIVTFIWRTLAR